MWVFLSRAGSRCAPQSFAEGQGLEKPGVFSVGFRTN